MEFYLIAGLIPFLMYGLVCTVFMFLNVAEGKWRINALLPLALFTPSLFTDKGNIYRKRTLAINILALVVILYVVGIGA